MMDQNSNFKTETTPEHKRNKKRGGKSIMKKFSKLLNFHNCECIFLARSYTLFYAKNKFGTIPSFALGAQIPLPPYF